MLLEKQQTQYQKEVIETLAKGAVELPLPEMIQALQELGEVGNLVFLYLSAGLRLGDKKWRLKVNQDQVIVSSESNQDF